MTEERPEPGGTELREGSGNGGVSRRSFMQTLGISAGASALAVAQESASATATEGGVSIVGPEPVAIELRVNGEAKRLMVDPATTLLEALRSELGMIGTKEICDRGACGGCSVLMDDRLTSACMTLALDAEGSEITTVEGLEKDGKLDPVQTEFIRHDAMQCGYCTPGLVIASRALLNENPKPTLEEIKEGLAGNLCRCGTYTNVFNAVLDASGQKPIQDEGGQP